MERLTEWTGECWIATTKRVNGKLVGDKTIYALCAAYEDTGLTPEEITAAADRRHNCKIECLLKRYNELSDETAALRQQLAEKGKENAGLITRCNLLMEKSTDLEDKLARVTAERDAAIDEIYYMGKRFNDCPTCNAYRTPECSVRWSARKDHPSISCWEWRELKKEAANYDGNDD